MHFTVSTTQFLQPLTLLNTPKKMKKLVLKIFLLFLIIHEQSCEAQSTRPPPKRRTPLIKTQLSVETPLASISDFDCSETLYEILKFKTKILGLYKQQDDFYQLIEKKIKGTNKVRPYTTGHCVHTKNIFDRNGKYLKSLCDVHEDINYKKAEKFCTDHGMDLLVVENEEVYKGMSEFLVEFYGDVPEPWNHVAGLWVNGERSESDNNCEWFVSKNGTKYSRPSGLPAAEEKNYPGNCFALKKRKEYEGRNYDCKKTYWFICEYASTF